MTDGALVFIHAHPDDECILTGATLAKAKSLGLRTVVVYGTRGDAGETNDDLGGEPLGERRVREAEAACAELGVSRVEWLPYDDSGMAGTETTSNPRAFSRAPADSAASLIADLLDDEAVSGVVGYDSNGTYGHPDHSQVHHVAHSLGRLLNVDWVFDATYNREYLASLPDSDGSLDPEFAAPEADLTHLVEGEQFFQAKLSALRHHLSQIPSDWDGENPDVEGFRARFGVEWFVATSPAGRRELGGLSKLFDPKSAWRGG